MCHKSCLVIGLIVNCRVLQDNVDGMLGENMNGLLVAYVGTLPLRVMKGSSLMVCDRPSVCAVVEVGKIPPKRGCVPAWLVCGAVQWFIPASARLLLCASLFDGDCR